MDALGFLLASCFMIVSVSGAGHVCCPDGWLTYSGSCYLITHDIFEDFFESENYCRNHGGHLVNVGSVEEDAILKTFMRRLNGSAFWLGLTDEISEGIWTWRDTGLDAVYEGWAPGEPNSFQGVNEDCAIHYQPLDYAWADASCLAKLQPVCELELGSNGNPIVG